MQLFFALSRVGIDGTNWSKRRFEATVTQYLKEQPGVQFRDLLEEGTGWDMYLALVPVADDGEALEMRKKVEELCRSIAKKCRPYYFRCRKLDVASIEQINMLGLTPDENRQFQDKAPAGVRRFIDV